MGKQLGIINVRGKVGDMGYVKTEDGYYVRRNTSVTAKRIRTDAAFENTRMVNTEFAVAAKTGKLLRDAIKIQLKLAGDSKNSSRLLKVMMQALKQDVSNPKGMRRPETGEFAFIEGFEFNKANELQNTFLVQYAPVYDRVTGKADISIPAFIPRDVLLTPPDATHMRLVSAACELNFEKESYVLGKAESAYIAIGAQNVNASTLQQSVTPDSDKPVVMILGIRFYQLVNGTYYQLKSEKFNAVRIVKTDVV